MARFTSRIISSLLLFLALCGPSLILVDSSQAQTTAVRGGTSGITAEVKAGALSGTEAGLVIRCASGCAGSGGTSQADDSTLSSITGMGALYDTTPPSITDGNVGIPRMDSSRYLIVNCAVGCSGSSFADNSAFTFGSTAVNPIAGVLDDTATNTATENAAAIVRITAQKGLHVNIRNASGSEVGTSGSPLRFDPTGTTAQPASQSGTWTVQPGNTANTTPWLTTISQGGNNATVNASGQLAITCANCSGSGASFVDDTAFTVASDSGAPAMGLFDDVTPDSVNEGDVGVVRMSGNRNLYTTLRDAAGNERGANVNASNQLEVAVGNTVNAAQSGTWNVTNISGTVSLPTGASTAANQTTIIGHVDGLEGVLGTTTDAAATAGSTGTISAKQRLMTSQLDSIKTAVELLDNAVSGAGFNITQLGGTNVVTGGVNGSLGVGGNVAHDAADSGNPVKIGCQARTTSRTAVADADRADVQCDKNGKPVVTIAAPRERVVRSGVITLTNTTETTLIAAGGAGVFRDLTYLKCTNNSSTLVRVDVRDATSGTVIDSWALAANGGGFNFAWPVPYAQATANNNWTVQLSASVTDVRCSAQAVENN